MGRGDTVLDPLMWQMVFLSAASCQGVVPLCSQGVRVSCGGSVLSHVRDSMVLQSSVVQMDS